MHVQGAITGLSDYDPLDLFSMDPGRMRRAIAALLDSPQNNLRVFRDGRPLPFRCDAARSAYICSPRSKQLHLSDPTVGHHNALIVYCDMGSGGPAELSAAVKGLLAADTAHIGKGLVEILVRVLLHTGANALTTA